MPPYDTNMGYRPPQAPQDESTAFRRLDLSPGQPMGTFGRRPMKPMGGGVIREPMRPQGTGIGAPRPGLDTAAPPMGGPMMGAPAQPRGGGPTAESAAAWRAANPQIVADSQAAIQAAQQQAGPMGPPAVAPEVAPPQLTPEQVLANSQRAGTGPGGPQYDAAGNMITPIVRWTPPGSSGLFSNRPGGTERSAFMGGY